jgi:predicted transcriptional regulator
MTAHKKTSAISLRVSDQTKDMLDWLAKRDNLTITNWLETTIAKAYREANRRDGTDSVTSGPLPSRLRR